MATNELNALIRAKDAAGNTNLIYPITKKENVEGLDEAITSAKAYTDAEIAEWVGDTTVSEQVSTAKSSAISTAASDATTKANSALSSAKKYADNTIADEVEARDSAIATAIATKSDLGHTHDDRYYTESEINSKLSGKSDVGHTHSEYVNQNSFSKVAVGSTTIEADNATDTLTLAAGSNITLTPDASGDKVTIAAKDTVYTHPNSGVTAGTYKSVTVNAQGHVTAGTNPTTLAGYGITDAEAKGAAATALSQAKTYADSAATTAANNVKNDLLNGAGAAYDTLKELGDLIDTNTDAIDALEAVAAGKANATHSHAISDVTGLQTALDGKAASSHGTHVSYSTTAPVMDGTASIGTASTVARSDHKHPTDTSRAAKTDLDSHTSNTTIHVTSAERTKWNAAKTHADSAHAPSNAEKNQNAFSNIAVGSTTIAADSATDTLTLAGSNVTITPDATNDKVTIGITKANVTSALGYTPPTTNTTYSAATTSSAGLMSASDKSKLDGIASGANKYSLPTATSSTLGGVKTGSNITNSSGTISLTKANVTSALGYTPPTTNTTYSAATTSAAGLMSASDKSKLDGIASGATKITVDSAMSSSSTNPVQNKVIQTALDKKPGRNVQGETILDLDEEEYIGGTCAEIFNDCECNIATGTFSHAEGTLTYAFGYCSHAEGESTSASGDYSHSEGYNTNASGECSHAEGEFANASGYCSHAEGESTNASGNYSHAEGYNTIANNYQHASGKYNVSTTAPSSHNTQNTTQTDGIFIVGCGTSSARKNAFRISSGGKCFGTASFGASGADFAELFEWADGNPDSEDRRGLFVTLDGEKIKLANAGDDYIGVISSAQAFVGNSASEDWQGKYLTDVFGAKLSQEVEVPAEIDEKTGEVLTPATTTTQYVLNPDYDPEQEYVMRENRKEWGIVGLLGQIVVIDDGTCVVGGRIEPSANGIGTSSTSGYRVMARIDENHVKVLVK